MKVYHFKNDHVFLIDGDSVSTVLSNIQVDGLGGLIANTIVKLNIEHTYTGDLEISLLAPSGKEISLANRLGRSGDHYEETVFDDAADLSINDGMPPYNDVYQPATALAQLVGENPNGLWQLKVTDDALQDGGELKRWDLQIITDEKQDNVGPFIFRNEAPIIIPKEGKHSIESVINVHGLDQTKIDSVCLSIHVEHSYLNDLTIHLIGPDETSVLLVDRVGGSNDDFINTAFDDQAEATLDESAAPFTGVFIPAEPLAKFKNKDINGSWKLRINDQANLDGGQLKSWFLSFKSTVTPDPVRPFQIEVNFKGGLSPSQRAIFADAAARWSSVITAALTPVQTDVGLVENLLIDAEAIDIDGRGGTLGQAGPTHMRADTMLPARGIMQFDTADVLQMEEDGELLDVIIHEMGHVLGIGTLWSRFGLVVGLDTNNPEFIGENAMREYSALTGLTNPAKVPVANTGGAGTRGGHWRESVFDTELMTGFDDNGHNALSRLTIASLQDLGYQVNYDAADAYILPFSLLSSQSVNTRPVRRCAKFDVPEMIVLPPVKDQV